MVTATLPSLGLGMEAGDKNIMLSPPRGLQEAIITKEVVCDIIYYGLVLGFASYGNYSIVLRTNKAGGEIPAACNDHYIGDVCNPLYEARGTAFLTLSLLLLLHAYNCRSMREPIYASKIGSNKVLMFGCLIGLVLVIPTLYIPGVNTAVFKHLDLSWEWGLLFAALFVCQFFIEAYKWGKRRFFQHNTNGIERDQLVLNHI